MPTTGQVAATDLTFTEAGYLAANPDVLAAVKCGSFASGREHFELYGRTESRLVVSAPSTARRYPVWLRRLLSKDSILASSLRIKDLEARVHALEVAARQQDSMLRRFHQLATPPPRHLQERVVGRYASTFIDSGFDGVFPALDQSLASNGFEIRSFPRILDFGSGCGRALIALSRLLPEAQLYGTDIDTEAIEWCRRNYDELASFELAPHLPPTGYPDESFDFIFGLSVMTHLPEEMQFAWLNELRRITRPGGVVLLTTHGENHHARLTTADQARLNKRGFIYIDSGYGQEINLPDFYQTAMHTHEYIRSEWANYFDVLDIRPIAFEQHQDIVVLSRRLD